MTMEERFARAESMHKSGGNCAQSVAFALEDLADIDETTLFRVMEGFGGGMGGRDATCGAVSGAVALAGLIKSGGSPEKKTKADTYKLSKKIVSEFKQQNGSIVCRELKGIDTGLPLRSCPDCIRDAVSIAVRVLGEEQDPS